LYIRSIKLISGKEIISCLVRIVNQTNFVFFSFMNYLMNQNVKNFSMIYLHLCKNVVSSFLIGRKYLSNDVKECLFASNDYRYIIIKQNIWLLTEVSDKVQRRLKSNLNISFFLFSWQVIEWKYLFFVLMNYILEKEQSIKSFSFKGTPVNRIPIMAKHVLDLCKWIWKDK